MKTIQIKIIVGSRNPVKINAVRNAMTRLFPEAEIDCLGEQAPSGVAEQPMTEQETRLGAINRVEFCQVNFDADYYVAMEGGVDNFEYGPATFAYVVIADKHKQSVGRSTNLPLPSVVFQALRSGEELGHVMDRLFNTRNIKQKGGAIGLLTNGIATRESIYTQALTLAFAPFLHGKLYQD